MAFDPNAFSQVLNNFSNHMKHEILTVSSLQQAKDFMMNKGDSYLLLEPNADLLYIKEMDNIGKVSLKIFSLADVTEQYISNNTPVTISKTEYTKLLNRLDQLEAINAIKESKQPELDFSGNGIKETT